MPIEEFGYNASAYADGGLGAMRWTDPTLTLLYQFAKDRTLAASKSLGPTLAITRATEGRFFDADGILQTAASGVARFDHNPTTGESLGLLVEEARTNLFLHSEDNGTTWTTVRSTAFQNLVAAPDGALTADILLENTGSGTHYQTQITQTHAEAAVVTISCYVKAADRPIVALFEAGANQGLFFNLTDSTTAVFTNLPTSSSITDVGNGWFRISITVTSTGTTSDIRIFSSTNMTTASHTGNGVAAYHIWGTQFEVGAFPTSYIPTVAASVTRNSDLILTSDVTWLNETEGTFYVTASMPHTVGNQTGTLFEVSLSNSDRYFIHKNTDTSAKWNVVDELSLQVGLSITAWADNVVERQAACYKVNDFEFFTNGERSGTGDQAGVLPTGFDEFSLATFQGGSQLNGHIAEIRYYNVRKDNAFLEALSNGTIPA